MIESLLAATLYVQAATVGIAMPDQIAMTPTTIATPSAVYARQSIRTTTTTTTTTVTHTSK